MPFLIQKIRFMQTQMCSIHKCHQAAKNLNVGIIVVQIPMAA